MQLAMSLPAFSVVMTHSSNCAERTDASASGLTQPALASGPAGKVTEHRKLFVATTTSASLDLHAVTRYYNVFFETLTPCRWRHDVLADIEHTLTQAPANEPQDDFPMLTPNW